MLTNIITIMIRIYSTDDQLKISILFTLRSTLKPNQFAKATPTKTPPKRTSKASFVLSCPISWYRTSDRAEIRVPTAQKSPIVHMQVAY